MSAISHSCFGQASSQSLKRVLSEKLAACAGDNWQYMGLYAKYGQPAGARFNQYDFRPEWDYYKADDNDMEIAFDASKQGFQTGVAACFDVEACPALPDASGHPLSMQVCSFNQQQARHEAAAYGS